MSSLTVQIDRSKKTALFFGPGTFPAKDQIKQLGRARWQGEQKSWLVSDFSLTDEQLNELFPDISIEKIGSSPNRTSGSLEVVASKPIKTELAKKKAISPISRVRDKERNEVRLEDSSETPQSYSVGELVGFARSVIQDAFPQILHVHGVLQSVKRYGERIYMNLGSEIGSKDSLSCVIWGGEAEICKGLIERGFKLEPELQVMFAVKVDLNPTRGSLSLSVVRVIPEYTVGKLAALRDKTNSRLKEEGLFEKNKELVLPQLPIRIGLLTSAGGTVINDFRAALDQSEFGFKLFWLPVSVQGSAAKKQLVNGIKRMSREFDLDLVLIFRGGGSVADLMVFNEYEVAKAVCKCPVPVLSAVGHQEDQSSAQDVSHLAFGVPKDLGRFLADLVGDLRARFFEATETVAQMSDELLDESKEKLNGLSVELVEQGEGLVFERREQCVTLEKYLPSLGKVVLDKASLSLELLLTPISTVARGQAASISQAFLGTVGTLRDLLIQKNQLLRQEFSFLSKSVVSSVEAKVRESQIGLSGHERLFSELAPETQLKRGFTMVRRVNGGSYVTSAEGLGRGDQVDLVFHDSVKKVIVE